MALDLETNSSASEFARQFADHGDAPVAAGPRENMTVPQAVTTTTAPPLEIVRAPAKELRLDLACGQSPREGFEGVDLWPGAKHQVNLMNFPWPWADDSVDELHCSHFVEHLPMVYVTSKGDQVPVPTGPEDKDLFFAFFDECWRILRPGGLMTVIVPALRSNRAFQDPTHRRFIPAESFLYLHRGWRELNRLDHYSIRSDFRGSSSDAPPEVQGQVPIEEGLRSIEVQMVRSQTLWNVVADWVAKLKKPAEISRKCGEHHAH